MLVLFHFSLLTSIINKNERKVSVLSECFSLMYTILNCVIIMLEIHVIIFRVVYMDDILKLIDNIKTDQAITFFLGTISGAIVSSLVSYFFSYIKDRYDSRDDMYLQISDILSKKLYECSQKACTAHIFQLKSHLSIYKSRILNSRALKDLSNNFKSTHYDSSSETYEAKQHLINEKLKVLDNISEFQKSLVEIVLYMEANYIALNIFSKHRDEYLLLSNRITKIRHEISFLLYFDDEVIKWEEDFDDTLLSSINNKLDEIEKVLSEIASDVLAYISDFQVGIQNKFFSKYFRKNFFQRYTLEYRKPLIGKVIKPEKSNKKNLTLYK